MKEFKEMILDAISGFIIGVVILLFIGILSIYLSKPTIEDNLTTVEEQTSTVVITEYTEEPTTEEIVVEEEINDAELELLAHIIFAEAGSDWCSDEMMYGVGSVVLNRMVSDYFPDTMYDVVFQKGQYACTWDGNINKDPNERAYRIAKDLLINGSTLPANVLFQAQFKQGDGVYKQVQNMYFCYIND